MEGRAVMATEGLCVKRRGERKGRAIQINCFGTIFKGE